MMRSSNRPQQMSILKNQTSLNDEFTIRPPPVQYQYQFGLPKPIKGRIKGTTTTQSESNIPSSMSIANNNPNVNMMSTGGGGAGIVRQKNVGSNDLADVTGGGGGGGLRSVSTTATLQQVNNAAGASTPTATAGHMIGGAASRSMPAVANPAVGLSNRSNSAGSSSVNARLNMMTGLQQSGASSRRSQQPQSRREEFEIYYQKCLKGLSHSINIIKATTMRLVFSLHSFIAIIYVYFVRQDEWYFLNFIGVVFLLIELFITIIKRKGKEPRWFFPCFFIYICTMIPPIWFVELTRIEMSNSKRRANLTLPSIPIEDLLEDIQINEASLLSNAKNLQQLDIATIAVGLEITLLMLVILGRWFLPKGNISRSTLSQLLLVYMSLASDIVDLLSLLNETQVQESAIMSYFTLIIFSWSLFQFSLNLVVTRGRSFQSVAVDDLEGGGGANDEYMEEDQYDGGRTLIEKLNLYAQNVKPYSPKSKKFLCFSSHIFRFDLFDSEIWSILITLIFQDGPFLALRLTAVIKFDVRTFVTMFFTCKNAIILFLQFYRLSAICNEATSNQNDPLVSNKADALASLNMAATFLDKFVCLSYAQSAMIKTNQRNKFGTSAAALNEVEGEKRLLAVNPILLRSTLSRNHSYAVVLTPNYNLNVSCCQCDCHPKDTTYL